MNPADNLNVALQLHQAGNLPQAEVIYRQILAVDAGQPDAWHLLGLLHYQRGQLQPAIDYMRRAIELKPGEALFYSNLGEAYRAGGQWPAAEECYRQALQFNPQYATALNNLGIVLNQQGQLLEGLDCLDRTLRLKPEYAEAHYNRGLTLMNLGRIAEAIAAYREALRWQPRYAAAWNNLGLTLQDEGQTDQALDCFQQAIGAAPNFAEAYNNQGNALKAAGRLAEAADSFRRALEINPRFVEPLNNLGTVARAAGHTDEAIDWYRRALAVKPGYVEAIANLGNAMKDQGRLDAAVEQYDAALAIDPNYTEAHIGRATVRLVSGDFARGWPEFEWRWKRAAAAGALDRGRPLWDGAPLAGRTILLTAEQGLGDTLHFVRYAGRIKDRGGRIVLECQPPLVGLLARTPGIDAVVAQGQPPAEWDLQAPLASLPGLFQTTLETIPADGPYVFPNAELASRWQQELNADTKLKIGVAWRGNPLHPGDRFRSFALAEFETLVGDRVHLYSLQKDVTADEHVQLAGRLGAVDLGPRLDDFDTTAAVVANLDLVITCDSALAHLAAAMGMRVWVAIPFAPDWRWLLDRDDSPWYASLRLFRQPQPGDWADVFRRIRAALDELLTEKQQSG